MNHGGPGYLCYTRYLALERTGWVEFGFYPLNPLDEDTHAVYYAKLLANLVGFLSLIQQMARERGIDPARLSLGVGLRGIKNARLECITRKLMRNYAAVTPPDRDNLLFLRTLRIVSIRTSKDSQR